MNLVRLHDRNFRLYIPHNEVIRSIRSLADRLNAEYASKPSPLFIGVMNGSFMFASELLQEIGFDCEISFIKLTSYLGTASTGSVSALTGLSEDIEGRDVIVLEDIIDTGRTITFLEGELKKRKPATIKFASLFFKSKAYRGDVPVDYYALELPDGFIVGFGLDYDGLGRNLRDVYTLHE